MREVLSLAQKDLRLLLRDRAGFFFTFFFPLLMAVFFGTIFSGDGEGGRALSVFVVDEDSTSGSAEFIEALKRSDALNVEITGRANAETQVRLGKRVAYIVIKKGFGEARDRLFWGEAPTVELGVDPARKAEAGLIGGVLMKHASERLQEVFSDPSTMRRTLSQAIDSLNSSETKDFAGREKLSRFLTEFDYFLSDTLSGATNGAADSTRHQALVPLRIEQADVIRERTGPQNAYDVSFPQGIVWGMIGCAAAFGISLVIERTRGTLVRLRIAPISRAQILAGKALACFTTTIFISISLLLIAFLFFGVVPGSLLHTLMAVVSVSVAFVGIMMLLAVLGKTERSAGGIGWAALLVMSMMGGGMIPLFVMPSWMQTVSDFSPIKWSILALEGALWRHFSLVEMLPPCAILLSVGVVCFGLGVRIFRWTQAS